MKKIVVKLKNIGARCCAGKRTSLNPEVSWH